VKYICSEHNFMVYGCYNEFSALVSGTRHSAAEDDSEDNDDDDDEDDDKSKVKNNDDKDEDEEEEQEEDDVPLAKTVGKPETNSFFPVTRSL